MSEAEKNTLQTIHAAAKNEFMKKGFKSASLRNIVKTAGVTTGAFYGYYNSKEELFDALVGEQYGVFMGEYKETQEAFTRLSPEEQYGQTSRRLHGLDDGICLLKNRCRYENHTDAE